MDAWMKGSFTLEEHFLLYLTIKQTKKKKPVVHICLNWVFKHIFYETTDQIIL